MPETHRSPGHGTGLSWPTLVTLGLLMLGIICWAANWISNWKFH